MKTKLIITGTGGQGVQTIAKILARVATEDGKQASYIPRFGVEQRGAPSVAFVSIDEKPIAYPLFQKADWLIIMHPKAKVAAEECVSAKTKVIFDESAMEKFSNRSLNLFMLGKMSRILNLPKDKVWQMAESFLEKKFKTQEIKKESREAFDFGYDRESTE